MTDNAEWLRDVAAHLNQFHADGGEIEYSDAPDDDPPPTLDQLAEMYPPVECSVCGGTDPGCPHDAFAGPTEAELPAVIESIKRFASIGNPPPPSRTYSGVTTYE